MVKAYIHEVKAIKYTGENKSMIKEFLGKGMHHYEGKAEKLGVKQSLWN